MNDTGGHDVGDTVLKRLARHLAHGVRTDVVVCRLGGDEFFGVWPRTPIKGARRLAEELRGGADDVRVTLPTGEWRASLSIGVAARAVQHAGLEELMKAADDAVYVAKKGGRNRVAAVG